MMVIFDLQTAFQKCWYSEHVSTITQQRYIKKKQEENICPFSVVNCTGTCFIEGQVRVTCN